MSDLLSPQVAAQMVGVIDLKNHQAVHGVAGIRNQYQPVAFCDGNPASLADHYFELGIRDLYVADLDSIGGGAIQSEIIEQLSSVKRLRSVLIDIGWTGDESAEQLDQITAISRSHPQTRWIAATESMRSIEAICQLSELVDPQRLLLGLDFADGQLQGHMGLQDWIDVATRYEFAGAVIIDLASVGGGNGPTMQATCQVIKSIMPNWTLFSGGGIRNHGDVSALIEAGCDRCLVATALHGIL